jgi:hypothetical protein
MSVCQREGHALKRYGPLAETTMDAGPVFWGELPLPPSRSTSGAEVRKYGHHPAVVVL